MTEEYWVAVLEQEDRLISKGHFRTCLLPFSKGVTDSECHQF